MNSFGQKIKSLRYKNGWHQEEVAKRLGISIPALSKIEAGITDINLSRMEQIAGLFEISVVQLLTNQDEEFNRQAKQLASIKQKIEERNEEIIDLQRKVIVLFEELRTG
jgi:transcriptional regulator with XRE-family HTH domain